MSIAHRRSADLETIKAEWLEHLSALVSHVKGWAEASGWQTREFSKPVTGPGVGRYDVPLLVLTRREIEVVLSPLARTAPDAEGVVDLCLMPAYDDVVHLVFEHGQWFIHEPSPNDPTAPRIGIKGERPPLDEETLRRVLDALAPHA